MTKRLQKDQAIILRSEHGLSIRKIAKQINVSQGTVSLWVRNIELTDEQKKTIDKNCSLSSYEARIRGGNAKRNIHLKLRQEYQGQGRELLKKYKNDSLFISGIIMYWCEGGKKNNRSSVLFTNSDIELMRIFLSFLIKFYNVRQEKIKFKITAYADFYSKEEIESYWLNGLNFPIECFQKIVLRDGIPCYNGKNMLKDRKKDLYYGTCRMKVNDVRIMQSIYGAIQEYGGFERPEWLG